MNSKVSELTCSSVQADLGFEFPNEMCCYTSREKRKSLGNLRSFYPVDDDDIIGSKSKVLKDPLHIMKSEEEITEATDHKLVGSHLQLYF